MNFNSLTIHQWIHLWTGLPTATAYFYARHFEPVIAYALLTAGLGLLATGLREHAPARVRAAGYRGH